MLSCHRVWVNTSAAVTNTEKLPFTLSGKRRFHMFGAFALCPRISRIEYQGRPEGSGVGRINITRSARGCFLRQTGLPGESPGHLIGWNDTRKFVEVLRKMCRRAKKCPYVLPYSLKGLLRYRLLLLVLKNTFMPPGTSFDWSTIRSGFALG